MAAKEAVKRVLFLRMMLESLGLKQKGPTTLYEDNTACIDIANGRGKHETIKHVDIAYHMTREQVVEFKTVQFKRVPTEDQVADLLTKPIKAACMERLRGRLLGYEPHSVWLSQRRP